MNRVLQKHRLLWPQRSFLFGVVMGFLFLVVALLGNYYANSYTLTHASNPVTDLLLDNIPTVNVDFIFKQGVFIFLATLAVILLYEPRRIPFVLKSIALFYAIRSIFITLTHLAPPLHMSYVNPADFMYAISSGGDLFFSGHTGLPFLLALIFWDSARLRYLFLTCTAIAGTATILGHFHYSIDVFAALFISFGIFHMAKAIFRESYRLF